MDNIVSLQCGVCKKIYSAVVDRAVTYIEVHDLPKCKCGGLCYSKDPQNIKPQVPIYVPPVVLKCDF